jgi:hypothetical protein
MIKKLHNAISRVSVFFLIWALLVCFITFIWWVLPFCTEQVMLSSRWGISLLLLAWLLYTKRVSIL